ncbi:type VI secretion protein VasK [Pandoraea terrae]|uniref:Type VI secretion protein VasK n=1 Tax=Pandoraea terrae TaxID=1537710 RepID=A0A5E4STP5_9BURK|nr:ImcF-related family protein [Pandoraea terrae]VVD78332.1 type VI secretion protein VasK [Pandoraea terrae]
MTKFRIDVFSYLLVAIAVGALVWFKGDLFWLDTETKKTLAIVALCAFLVAMALYFGFEPRREEADASRRLTKLLHWNPARLTGTTQALLVPEHVKALEKGTSAALLRLRDELRVRHGLRWRYRQPWLLLTGDDAVIARLMSDFADQGWLVTPDAVLLWSKNGADGRPDANWLKQLYQLRRGRPVDAVVLALDGTQDLSGRQRGADAHHANLAAIAEALHWAAPVYLLDVAQTDDVAQGATPVIGCEFPRQADAPAIEAALLSVRAQLADRGVAQLVRNGLDRYAAELSERLDTRCAPLASWIAGSPASVRRQSVRGVYFAPYPSEAGAVADSAPADAASDAASNAGAFAPDSADLPLWQHIGRVARRAPGRRIGWHPVTVFSTVALCALGLWSAGMLVSGLSNARELHLSEQAVRALASAPDAATRLRALLALQQRIDLYDERTRDRAPLHTRFGLNRDADVLAALWRPYAQASQRVLVTPVKQSLEAELADLSQMQTTEHDNPAIDLALDGHKALKTYLMLAEPGRADAAFMTPLLARYWRADADMPTGETLDLAERLLGFYARHLPAHEDWRIAPHAELVSASRQTLLAAIGVKNSEDTIYQGILDALGNKYPDQSLASLTSGTDTRGLLRASAIVPGAFTRQAYAGSVEAAIDAAAKRGEVAGDWVLAGVQAARPQAPALSVDARKAALRSRYFADYAGYWQQFMNTLQWAPAPTLPAAIEQLKLMADARQSPVIALMKSLEYQGGAGALTASLSDTLVTKAQNMLGSKIEAPQMAKPDPAGPLGASFGPVLRLVAQGDANAPANGELSLQRFMERVTALRLRLQQISDSPDADAQARQAAQSLFQGGSSPLADTQAYAALLAASLGEQWAGMGDALFVRPVAQATQTVLRPAQASFNEAWRQTIVATWDRSFAGRYPFADTDNDASLPELARFLRPQGGLIASFLGAQLAGVLELQGDQWVPASTGGRTLPFDPAFLAAVNTLQRIAVHLLAQGEPQYRFDLKPVPTPGVTDTVFTLDGQRLHYYNQQESWQALTWPSGDSQHLGTGLTWQTETAGTTQRHAFGGRWGLVRMLEQARVEPLDNATYQLTWQGVPQTNALTRSDTAARTQDDDAAGDAAEDADRLVAQGPRAPAPETLTYPLRYLMRTDVGRGPLDLLALRGFVLPQRVFMDRTPGA